MLFEISEQSAFVELWVAIKIIDTLVNQLELRNPYIVDQHRILWDDLQKLSKNAEDKRKLIPIVNLNVNARHSQDFRTISLFPSVEELQPHFRPFLKANLTKGKYESLDEYIEVQFRLFREDLVAPLRNGIRDFLREYRESTNGKTLNEFRAKKRITDIRVYYDVRLQSPYCEDDGGLLYRIRFSLDGLQRVRWANSKRLMYGSLLCLSSDGFQTVRFATVYNRDLLEREGHSDIKQDLYTQNEELKSPARKYLRNKKDFSAHSTSLNPNFGYILVRFEDTPNTSPVSQIADSEIFTMIESAAYFEAYRHTLQRLLVIRRADLPRHERYLVQCATDMRPPAYLTRPLPLSTKPDESFEEKPLTPTNEEHEGSEQKLERDAAEPPMSTGPSMNMTMMAVDKDSEATLSAVRMLEPLKQWPSPEMMGLDSAQQAALHAALTQELALILGPPGTGKTFLGMTMKHLDGT